MAKANKKKKPAPKLTVEELALSVTRWVGSIQSVAIHTVLFVLCFGAVLVGAISFERMLLVLTTIVSLEAIYLSIFIQLALNHASASIKEVEQDIDAIQEDIDEIQEDVGEIQEDVDDLQEDVAEMTEEEKEEEALHAGQTKTLDEIRAGLQKLMSDIEKLKQQ